MLQPAESFELLQCSRPDWFSSNLNSPNTFSGFFSPRSDCVSLRPSLDQKTFVSFMLLSSMSLSYRDFSRAQAQFFPPENRNVYVLMFATDIDELWS